jgi:excisionase family DNA binding protein
MELATEQSQARIEPEVVSVAEARVLTNLGTTKIYELIADKQLETLRIGRRRLIRLKSIRALLGTA